MDHVPTTTIIDMDVVSSFQEELHSILPGEDDQQPVACDFHLPYVKTTYCYYLPKQMEPSVSSEDGKTVITFTSMASAYTDYLMYSVRIQDIPRIAVKSDYIGLIEICWCHHIGNNSAPHGVFKSDDEPIYNIDRVFMDDDKQFFAEAKSGYVPMLNRCHGSTDELKDWSTVLAGDRLSIKDPWHYSKASALAYPIFYNRGARITHRYTLVDDIFKLLRVRIRKDVSSPWMYTKGFHSKYFEGPKDGKLPNPQLWGYYGRIRNDERIRILYDIIPKSNGPSNGPDNNRNQTMKLKPSLVMFIEDSIVTQDDTIRLYGQVAEISLDSPTPCKGITVKAENLDATELNNHSNYTTDTNNLHQGYNPLTTFTQSYGGKEKFTVDRVFTERIFPMVHCGSCPEDPGYNFIPIAWDCGQHYISNGLVFAGDLKSTLRIKLGNTDPNVAQNNAEIDDSNLLDFFNKNSNIKNKEVEIKSPSFRVHARLIIIRKIVFNYSDTKKAYLIGKII